MSKTLRTITTALGLRTETVHPRVHDLRHSFAVQHPDRLAAIRRARSTSRSRVLSTYLGHVSPADTYWYLTADPGADGARRAATRRALRSTAMSALAPALQAYFTDRLIGQRAASPNTIAAYRDTFRLLLALRRRANRHATQRARHRRSSTRR